MSLSSKQAAHVRAYGFGHFGKSLIWNTGGLLFAYYLTEIAGLPALLVGLLMGGAMLLNAGADLALGASLSVFVTDCDSAARFQRVGAKCASLTLVAFASGALIPLGARIPWLIATLVAFRVSYAFFDVPQNAYLAFATQEMPVRAALSSVRFTASGAANLVLGLVFVPISTMRGAPEARLAFLSLAVLTALITILGAYGVPARAIPDLNDQASSDAEGCEVKRKVPYLNLLVAIAVVTVASEFFNRQEAHFAALAAPGAAAPWLLVAAAAGQISSQPAWRRLASANGEVTTLLWACLAWAACVLLTVVVPINGVTLLLGGFTYSACLSGVAVGMWMALARSGAAPGQATKRVGGFTFVAKMTEAATMPVIGALLEKSFYGVKRWPMRELWLTMLLPAAFAALVLVALTIGPSRNRSPHCSRRRLNGPCYIPWLFHRAKHIALKRAYYWGLRLGIGAKS